MQSGTAGSMDCNVDLEFSKKERRFPHLLDAASRLLLGTTATSVASERVFSHVGGFYCTARTAPVLAKNPGHAHHWRRRRGCRGVSAPQKFLMQWKSRQNPLKSGQNLWKFGQNVWKPSQNRFMCFDFTKMAPKIKVFFWRSLFFRFFRAS